MVWTSVPKGLCVVKGFAPGMVLLEKVEILGGGA